MLSKDISEDISKNISGAMLWRHLRRYFSKISPELCSGDISEDIFKNISGATFRRYFPKISSEICFKNTLPKMPYRRYFTGDTLPKIPYRKYFTGDTWPNILWVNYFAGMSPARPCTLPEVSKCSNFTESYQAAWRLHLNCAASSDTLPEMQWQSAKSCQYQSGKLETSPECPDAPGEHLKYFLN